MFEELLATAKAGKPFTREQLSALNNLSDSEKEKIHKAIHKASEAALNTTINNEFRRVYYKAVKNDPEFAMWLGKIAKVDDDNFNELYHDDKNYSLNEVMVAVIRDEDTPLEVVDKVKEKLYQKNIGLIGSSLRKYSNKDDGKMSMEDLGQELRRVFFERAVPRYEFDKQIRFSTFTMTVFHNYLAGLHKNKINKQRAIEVSFETPVVDDGGAVKTLLDYQIDNRATAADMIRRESENAILYDVLNELTLEQKFVAYCRYGLGGIPKKTQKEIADYMHMSQANVSKIENNMRAKLKQKLNEVGMF